MEYEAVLFDLDNTLYPYPPCNEAGKEGAWQRARELGYDLDRGEFETLYQEGRRAVKRELDGYSSAHERYLYFKQALERRAKTVKASHALELGAAYWDTYVTEMQLVPGVRETFVSLADSGVDIGIVTNLTTRIQMRKVRHLGIERELDLFLTSEEAGRKKPNSVMFTTPLARLGATADDVLMVGDSLAADIEGANAVGLDTALFSASANEEWETTRSDPDTGLYGERPADEEIRTPDYRLEAFDEVQEVVL